jgi:hypothetical protein
MFPSRLAFAVIAVASVTAAGAGAYFATRQHGPALVEGVTTATSTSQQAVQETEAEIGEAPSPRRNQAPEPFRAPAKRDTRAATNTTKPQEPLASRPIVEAPIPPPDRTWPTSASTPQAEAPVPEPPPPPAPAARVEEPRSVEPVRSVPEPPVPTVHEVIVSADSVLGLQLESTISSERAKIEDRVEARVARDVRVGSDVAIPAGSRALGSVMTVERGGRLKDRARLGIRFHTLVLADGTQLPITSETIYRTGDAPAKSSTAKIGGGAVAGAILGAIIGGGKGAAIGGAAGAGAGTATVMAGDRSAAVFQSGAEVTARILSPVTVTVEK